MQKKDIFLKKIAKIFAYIKKKLYLCTRFRKKSTSLVRLSSCTTSCTRSVSLAQLVEQLTLNQWVESSSLSGDTKDIFGCLFLYPSSNYRESSYLIAFERLLQAIFEPLGGHKRTSKRVSFFVGYKLSAKRSASSIWLIFPTSIMR